MKIKLLIGALIFSLLGALMLIQLHTVQAIAIDGGNLITSPITGPIPSPTPTPDITPPVVFITNPLFGSYVRKNRIINIEASASDNVAVSKVEVYVDNNLLCIDTSSPYSCSWFVPKKPRVTYTLTAKAIDTSNNSTTHSISVTSK